jgi:hypothetical protein
MFMKRRSPSAPAVVLAAMTLIAMCSHAAFADGIKKEAVRFRAGATSAMLHGSLIGDETIDYVLGAREGQTMHVTIKTDNGANYFNVLPPKSEAALAIGSTLGNEWSGTLPVDGDYTVRVYLMRSAARRNEKASYTLTVGITGRPDAMVPGTPYHATGIVPCAVGTDPKGSAQCSFGVIRGTPGNAEVHLAHPGFDVTLHKDDLRVLKFAGDEVTSANSSETVKSEKHGDTWSISVNDFYFYEIPEAVIVGG